MIKVPDNMSRDCNEQTIHLSYDNLHICRVSLSLNLSPSKIDWSLYCTQLFYYIIRDMKNTKEIYLMVKLHIIPEEYRSLSVVLRSKL